MLARHEAPSWQVNQGGIWQPVGFFGAQLDRWTGGVFWAFKSHEFKRVEVDLGKIKDFHQLILEFGECIELVDVVVPCCARNQGSESQSSGCVSYTGQMKQKHWQVYIQYPLSHYIHCLTPCLLSQVRCLYPLNHDILKGLKGKTPSFHGWNHHSWASSLGYIPSEPMIFAADPMKQAPHVWLTARPRLERLGAWLPGGRGADWGLCGRATWAMLGGSIDPRKFFKISPAFLDGFWNWVNLTWYSQLVMK